MKNKIVGLVLLLLAVFSCQSQKEINSKITNSIQEVCFQKWVAGVRGGGAGINFHVALSLPFSGDIQLEKVVFKGKEAVFSTQDKLNYVANIITKKGGELNHDQEDNQTALPQSNEAKLYFRIKGKKVIHTIKSVKEKEMLAYPSMNKSRE